MINKLEKMVNRYRELGIDKQIDYDKFHLYSLITHSTAIEGSTITELENQIMFDHGVSIKGKSIEEQSMNLDLKAAYEKAIGLAKDHVEISVDLLISLASIVMKNTGVEYKTALGNFSTARGELRLLNVTAGFGGRSYMNFNKVPAKLVEFCKELNVARKTATNKTIDELYQITFDAHYNLVTIHPWADGNGRMARLLMNMLQFEFNLIPTIIHKEDKEEYIKALVATREEHNLNIFREFMTSMMERNLAAEIDTYLHSIGEGGEITEKTLKSRDKIIALLSEDGTLSAKALSTKIGITPKAVEKHLARLKADGIIERIGPARGGYWRVR
ncbi:MAG TPA: Fic family protein [Bacteroidales bacterium]|nr:Fic family protein [Bacteroidales bacterium]HPY21754.1 Fic family protein [Bacteroidales bacterium]HQA93167.1 Fic family protein [Bacteroidales bacterium]HQP78476.1 Fic family protein [Bacteroidales bacterium]